MSDRGAGTVVQRRQRAERPDVYGKGACRRTAIGSTYLSFHQPCPWRRQGRPRQAGLDDFLQPGQPYGPATHDGNPCWLPFSSLLLLASLPRVAFCLHPSVRPCICQSAGRRRLRPPRCGLRQASLSLSPLPHSSTLPLDTSSLGPANPCAGRGSLQPIASTQRRSGCRALSRLLWLRPLSPARRRRRRFAFASWPLPKGL